MSNTDSGGAPLLGQNTVGLLLKVLILARGGDLPGSYGGYIQRFGELYVLLGEVNRDCIEIIQGV